MRWDSWRSAWHSGNHIDGSGVSFYGTAGGRRVARTYDGREWMESGNGWAQIPDGG